MASKDWTYWREGPLDTTWKWYGRRHGNFLDPIFSVGGPAHGFVHGFAHGFGHDGFFPLLFCRSGQGNYGYVLIQG